LDNSPQSRNNIDYLFGEIAKAIAAFVARKEK